MPFSAPGTLARRLFLAVLPVPILVALLAYGWLSEVLAQGLRSQELIRARSMAQSLANGCALALEREEPELVQVSLNALFLHRDVAWVEAVGKDGRWLAHFDPSLVGQPARAVESDPRILEARAPIQWRQREWGELLLGLRLDRLEQALATARQRFLAISLGLVALTALLVAGLAHRLTQPISRLASLADQIARGEVQLETVAERMARDGSQARRSSDGMVEIRILARAFLEMSGRMHDGLALEQQQLQDLQRQVTRLLHYQEEISRGHEPTDLGGWTSVEFQALAAALRQMSLNLQENARSEVDYRRQLEEFNHALQETRGRLEETDRYKNEFLGVVSHELRTPLTSVRAFAEILLDCPPEEPDERRDFVQIIYHESDRLTRIINHLLDISRIESNRMRWHLAPVNLMHLLESQLSQLEFTSRNVHLELEVDFRPGGYTLWLDGEKMGEALEAVLTNALLHSPEGGQVKVRIQTSPGEEDREGVEISIADQGPGIPPESQELIFSKFQRVRLGNEPRATGLSLALARAIVEAHQGRLQVESDGHQGSRFFFWLPLEVER